MNIFIVNPKEDKKFFCWGNGKIVKYNSLTISHPCGSILVYNKVLSLT